MLHPPSIPAFRSVTRVDFYILSEASGSVVSTVCKLCDKATQTGARLYLHSADPDQLAALDTALWTFRQGSFLSHERLREESPQAVPLPMVLLGSGEPPQDYHEVLVNLDTAVPPFFSRFERVLEVVGADADARSGSRERYRWYRDRGYELATHNL